MQEIKYTDCSNVFQVKEPIYYSIFKQVSDKEFSKEIQEREKHYTKEKAHCYKTCISRNYRAVE